MGAFLELSLVGRENKMKMKNLFLVATLFSFGATAATTECETFTKEGGYDRSLMSFAHVGQKTGVVFTSYTADPFNPTDPAHFFFEMSKQELVDNINNPVLKNDRVEINLTPSDFRIFVNCVGAK